MLIKIGKFLIKKCIMRKKIKRHFVGFKKSGMIASAQLPKVKANL